MPIGKPSAQTKANEKWQKKAGYTVKSFKVRDDIVKQFVEACQGSGRSQASVIQELMQDFIKKSK